MEDQSAWRGWIAYGVAFGGCLAACLWIVIFFSTNGPSDHLSIGVLMGSLFGYSALASTWVALGPGNWQRLPLAALWALAIPGAIVLTTLIKGNFGELGILWGSSFAIVVLVQALAWPVRFCTGVHIIAHQMETPDDATRSTTRQFGIKHLLIANVFVAVVIAVGRLLVPAIQAAGGGRELLVIVFLVVVTIAMCGPLLLAILGMSKPLLPTLVVLVLIALGTYVELPILKIFNAGAPGPDWLHILWINLFTLLPVVLVTSTLRWCGYRLA